MKSMRIGWLLVIAACGSKKDPGTGSATTGSAATGSAATGSAATGSAATGSATTGSAATGSAATGSAATGSAATGSGSAPASTTIYGSLFTKGTSWSFTSETKTTPPVDMGKPTTAKNPSVTCTVTDVHEMKSSWMSKVECKPEVPGNHPPSGWYAANKDGLWRFDADDAKAHDKANALDANTMLIQATPAARNFEGKGPDEGESWVYETKKDGDAWCGYYSHALGDEGGWGFCFDAKGMVKANYFQAGATTVETFYKRS